MTKEKLAKLRGMGLVFDDVFDALADTKKPVSENTTIGNGAPENADDDIDVFCLL